MQASVTGLKEKFDPLNIASKLTGGSRIGSALLGRMTWSKLKKILITLHTIEEFIDLIM
jgi:hypothetical protein